MVVSVLWSSSLVISRPLSQYEVLLALAVENNLQRGTLYPHLGMEEVLCLFSIFWFLLLDIHGGNSGVGLLIDNMLPPVIPLVSL